MKTIRPAELATEPAPDFEPYQVDAVELSGPLPALTRRRGPDGSPYRRSKVLVRLHGQPLGQVDVPLSGDASPADVARLIESQLSGEIAAHLR